MAVSLFAPCLALVAALLTAIDVLAADFSRGDLVRLTRRETLQFNGKNLVTVPKGGEFIVLKQDATRVFVEYYQDDGTLVAATLAAEAAERSATGTALTREDPARRTPAARAVALGRQALALRRLL